MERGVVSPVSVTLAMLFVGCFESRPPFTVLANGDGGTVDAEVHFEAVCLGEADMILLRERGCLTANYEPGPHAAACGESGRPIRILVDESLTPATVTVMIACSGRDACGCVHEIVDGCGACRLSCGMGPRVFELSAPQLELLLTGAASTTIQVCSSEARP